MSTQNKSVSELLDAIPAVIARTNDGGMCLMSGPVILSHIEAIRLLNQIRDWYDAIDPSAIEESNASPIPRNEHIKSKVGYVYLIHDPRRQIYKIGMALDPAARFRSLQSDNNHALKLLHTIPCSDYRTSEQHLHQIYAERRTNGEWFALTQSDVDEIKGIVSL